MYKDTKTKMIIRIALFSAIAGVLSFYETQVPIFPFFLKIDIADVPAVIGAIVLGPIPAVMIMFIKNIISLIMNSSSAGVGQIANFLIGSSLVVPVGIAMNKNKTGKNFIIGAIIGVVFMVISASILNIYVLLPMYATLMDFPIEKVVAVSNALNSNVTSLNTYILYMVVPFNLLKGFIVMTLGYVLFKFLKKPLLNL